MKRASRGPYLKPREIDDRVLKARLIVNSGRPTWQACLMAGISRRTYHHRISLAMASEYGAPYRSRIG